jgi:hypothetical protein
MKVYTDTNKEIINQTAIQPRTYAALTILTSQTINIGSKMKSTGINDEVAVARAKINKKSRIIHSPLSPLV